MLVLLTYSKNSLNVFDPFSNNPDFLPKQQIFDAFKLKDFADDNFKFDENGRKIS